MGERKSFWKKLLGKDTRGTAPNLELSAEDRINKFKKQRDILQKEIMDEYSRMRRTDQEEDGEDGEQAKEKMILRPFSRTFWRDAGRTDVVVKVEKYRAIAGEIKKLQVPPGAFSAGEKVDRENGARYRRSTFGSLNYQRARERVVHPLYKEVEGITSPRASMKEVKEYLQSLVVELDGLIRRIDDLQKKILQIKMQRIGISALQDEVVVLKREITAWKEDWANTKGEISEKSYVYENNGNYTKDFGRVKDTFNQVDEAMKITERILQGK